MSPEQARGEPATAASDMFCFGLLLFELYCGRAPYAGGTAEETLTRAQWGDVPPVTGVDHAIASLIRDFRISSPAVGRPPSRRLNGCARSRDARTPPQGGRSRHHRPRLLTGTALSLLGLARAGAKPRLPTPPPSSWSGSSRLGPAAGA